MLIAYFDASAGVSGDMMLGALVDAGLGLTGLQRVLAGLDLGGYRLRAEEVKRTGFRATKVHVDLQEEQVHGHEAHHHGRRLSEIYALIERSRLQPSVKRLARRVFERLGEAEAVAHGTRAEDIHLHEVGAVDALVDIVGSIAGLDALGVEKVYFSPLRLGYGTVQCAHGILPVPPPAVAELVKGIPVYAGDVEGELVTPTGAALAVTLAESFGPMPGMIPEFIGLGAGTAERRLPNILRLFLGRPGVSLDDGECSELVVLETNIDDMNPEFYEHLCGVLMAEGARDVWLIPVQMKKGRPGTQLGVLADPAAAEELRAVIFKESTTLGVREQRVVRYALARESMAVQVAGRRVRIKIGRRQGRIVQIAPEYEDCRQVAAETGLAIKEVYQEALAAARAASAGGPNGVREEKRDGEHS